MRVTEVSLKNIKSYQEASIRLPQGTIAISGPNGAGKSTILEAIGFALFDFLPYRNQRDFMRHNALEADVRVTFLSRLDECQYQAVRSLKRATGSAETVTSTYYVYSLDRSERVAQQKQAVQDFLRAHIGLEDYDDLARVFDNVLGVPQGRLTADFQLSPAQRKSTFDPLLHVDTYRHAYDRLRDVLDALQGIVSDRERRVSALEPEAARLPEASAALAESEKELSVAAMEAHNLAATQTHLLDELERLEAQRRTLEQQRDLARRLTQQREQLQSRLEAERVHVDAARDAVALTESAAPGYASFRRAQAEFAQLEERRTAAETLRKAGHTAERTLVALQTRQDALETAVEEACRAAALRDTLMPQVAEQERLEALVQEFNANFHFARQYGEQALQVLGRIMVDEEDVQRIQAADSLPAETAASAVAVRSHLEDQHNHLQEVGLWLEQRKELRNRYQRLQSEHNETKRAVAHCESFMPSASRLSGLEQQLQGVRDRISAHEAQRDFNQESQAMAADGLCPFFRDACPKVDDGQSLVPVIDRLIRDSTGQAEEAQMERHELEQAIAEATSAQKQVDRLQDLSHRLRQLEGELREVQTQIQDLSHRIGQRLHGAWSAPAIAALLAQLQATGESLERQRAELGDPRQAAERLYGTADAYAKRAEALVATKQELSAIEREVAAISAKLAPYADLEERVQEQRLTVDAHREDYEAYLQHERIAADLPRREELLAALVAEMEENSRAVVESQHLLTQCEEAWDPSELADAQARLNQTQGQLGAANERRRLLGEQIEREQREVAALEEASRELTEARQALQEARGVQTVAGFLRNVIRDAGPHITRHLIQQISAEANTLFSEVMGDASAELSLTEDYDIILEQHGHRRTFAQLSGGEQMSAAVAVRLGLLRQLSDINIAFFDEPTQNMDAERRHNLAEQLERVTGFNQLFVISHDDTFEPMVSTVLRVRKENGVSTVEME